MSYFSKNRTTGSLIVAAAALLGTAGSAWAGCSPACPKGEVCRYEAAGGTFSCAASKAVIGADKVSAPTFTAPGDVAGRTSPTSKSLTTTKPGSQIDMGPMPGRVREPSQIDMGPMPGRISSGDLGSGRISGGDLGSGRVAATPEPKQMD